MDIRAANSGDVLGIGTVADAAYRTTYTSLLRPETIGRFLGTAFSPSGIRRRVLRGGVFVAGDGDRIIGFADGVVEGDTLEVSVIAVAPGVRQRGVATALVRTVARRHPRHALCAGVLLGNLAAERLFERLGFVPGEIVATDLFAEDVVERRWWREPGPEVGALRSLV